MSDYSDEEVEEEAPTNPLGVCHPLFHTQYIHFFTFASHRLMKEGEMKRGGDMVKEQPIYLMVTFILENMIMEREVVLDLTRGQMEINMRENI